MDQEKMIERNWKTMIKISHNFFHCWRQAALDKYGEEETDRLVLSFWENVGLNTAESYLKIAKIDPDNLEQVVRGAARSSEIMDENVTVEKDGDSYLLVHHACPWIESYREAGAPGKCKAGCDRWFAATAAAMSPSLGVETLSSLAAGDDKCVRKFYKK